MKRLKKQLRAGMHLMAKYIKLCETFIKSFVHNIVLWFNKTKHAIIKLHNFALENSVYKYIGIECGRVLVLGILSVIALYPIYGFKPLWAPSLGLMIWLPIQILVYAVSEVRNEV